MKIIFRLFNAIYLNSSTFIFAYVFLYDNKNEIHLKMSLLNTKFTFLIPVNTSSRIIISCY